MANLSSGPRARFATVMRSVDIMDGLAARLADPLWMLARQWQFGEFTGDDTGSPVSLSFQANAHAPTWWRPEPDPARPAARPWQPWTVRSGPIESVIDAEIDDGTALVRLRLEGGAAARRALCTAGLSAIAAALPALAPWVPADVAGGVPVEQAFTPVDLAIMAGTADPVTLDTHLVPWADTGADPPATLLDTLAVAAPDAAAFATAMRGWHRWWRTRFAALPTGSSAGPVDPPAWDPLRLEHRASLGFASAPKVALHLDRHPGGQVDWYSADIGGALPADTAGAPPPPADLATPQPVTALSVPQPARFAGMPALRFWEFEDSRVDFGSVDASAADLARLLLVEYTTVYDHNWYLSPLRVPVGALLEVDQPVTVVDSFGQTDPLEPLAARQAGNTRMFNLRTAPSTRTDLPAADPAWATHWFWFAPRLAATLGSAAVEQIMLRRDEMANIGWAIIGSHPDAAGRPRIARSRPEKAESGTGSTARCYTLQSPIAPNWFPLVPTPITPAGACWLVREDATAGVPPPGRLLSGEPWKIHEEELGAAGAVLTRTRTLARWHDGLVYTWTSRSNWAGGGEADSGLNWDYLR